MALPATWLQTLQSLHCCGYVVGDINQKNVLVSNNVRVTLVDADSLQVRDASGRVFLCPVGVPEYTPPELQGVHLGNVERTEYHDRFGLKGDSVPVADEGVHPFTGTPRNPGFSVTGEFYLYCIQHGIFPISRAASLMPPPGAPPFTALHPGLQHLFRAVLCKADRFRRTAQRA